MKMRGENTISPYPPSFSKREARSIDPNPGDSTCALASQLCKKNIGSLTRKLVMKIKGKTLKLALKESGFRMKGLNVNE